MDSSRILNGRRSATIHPSPPSVEQEQQEQQTRMKEAIPQHAQRPSFGSLQTLAVSEGSDRRRSSLASVSSFVSIHKMEEKSLSTATSPSSTPSTCWQSYQHLRKQRPKWVCCGWILIVLIVVTSLMLTVGVKVIAEYAIANWYPLQFNVESFQFTQLSIGPMQGQQVGLAVHARLPQAMPVTVRIRQPMTVHVSYMMPSERSEDDLFLNQTQAGFQDDVVVDASTTNTSSTSTSSTSSPTSSFTSTPISLGLAYLEGEDLLLTNQINDTASMQIQFNVTDPFAFSLMVDHVLSVNQNTSDSRWLEGKAYTRTLNGGYRLMTADVVLQVQVLLSAVDIMVWQTPVLTIPGLEVNKLILLKNLTTTTEPPNGQITSVQDFFNVVSRILAGDTSILSYASEYLSLSQLVLYDDQYENPVPAYFADYYPYEFAWKQPPLPVPDEAGAVEEVVYAGVNLTSILPSSSSSSSDSPSEEEEETVIAGSGWSTPRGDPSSLPFSLVLTFYNPTNVTLKDLGSFMVLLNYKDVTIANVTVPQMHLDAQGYTNVTIFGYLRKEPGRETILETEVPQVILRGSFLFFSPTSFCDDVALTSGQFEPLPFSLCGAPITPRKSFAPTTTSSGVPTPLMSTPTSLSDDAARESLLTETPFTAAAAAATTTPPPSSSSKESDILSTTGNETTLPAAFENQPLYLAVQAVLAARSVEIGHYYMNLGPTYYAYPNATGSLALAKLFRHIPVLGDGGLGDVLNGLKLHLNWAILSRGWIPVTCWLVNPLTAGIGIRQIGLRVFADPLLDETSLGSVGMPRDHAGDARFRYQIPEVMPPGYHTESTPWFTSGSTESLRLLQSESPQYYFSPNTGGIMGDLSDAVRQLMRTVKEKEFILSMAVDVLHVKIGRFEWKMQGISQRDLAHISLFPKELVLKLGWPRLMAMLFGEGWNLMNTDGVSIFRDN